MGLFNLFWDNVSQYLMALIIEAHYLSLVVYWTCFLRERGHQCLSSLLCYNYTRVIQILQLWLSSCKIRQQEEMRSIKHRTREGS